MDAAFVSGCCAPPTANALIPSSYDWRILNSFCTSAVICWCLSSCWLSFPSFVKKDERQVYGSLFFWRDCTKNPNTIFLSSRRRHFFEFIRRSMKEGAGGGPAVTSCALFLAMLLSVVVAEEGVQCSHHGDCIDCKVILHVFLWRLIVRSD